MIHSLPCACAPEHTEPITDDCLPPQQTIDELFNPRLDAAGRYQDGPCAGMTPGEVLSRAKEYERLYGGKINMRRQ